MLPLPVRLGGQTTGSRDSMGGADRGFPRRAHPTATQTMPALPLAPAQPIRSTVVHAGPHRLAVSGRGRLSPALLPFLGRTFPSPFAARRAAAEAVRAGVTGAQRLRLQRVS